MKEEKKKMKIIQCQVVTSPSIISLKLYIIVRHDSRHDSLKTGTSMKVECDLPLTGDDLRGEGAELCVYCWLGRSGVFPLLGTLLLKNVQSRAGELNYDSTQ